MKAGNLDRRITIERAATPTVDAFNSPLEAWSTLATVWASKNDLSDSERARAREVGAEIGTRWQIRNAELVRDVNPKDRLTHKGRVHQIVSVKEVGRLDILEISTIARAD